MTLKLNVSGGIDNDDIATAAAIAFTKLATNPNGNVPGMTLTSVTRDTSLASGNQAITSIGFTPRLVIFLVSVTATPQVSVGFDNGTSRIAIYNNHAVAANNWEAHSTQSIVLFQGAGIAYSGNILSLDADGFTISWTKTGAKTGVATLQILAIR